LLKDLTSRVFASSQQVFIGSMVLQAFTLGSAISVSRALGPYDRGIFSSVILIALTTSSLGVAGLDVVLARAAGTRSAELTSTLWLHSVIATLPLAISVYAISSQIVGTPAYWPWVPLLMFSSVFNNIALVIVLAIGNIKQFNRSRMIFSAGYAAASILGLFAGVHSIEFFIISYTLASVVATFSFLIFSPLLRPAFNGNSIELYLQTLGRASGFAISAALSCLASNYFQLAAMFVFDKETFGLIAVALTIVQAISIFAASISKGLFSVLINNAELRITYQNWTMTAVIASVIGCLSAIYTIFMTIADTLIPLVFGPAFVAVASSFFWFAVGGAFMCGVMVLDEAIRAERAASIISFSRVGGMACGAGFWFAFGQQTLNSAGLLFAVFNGAVLIGSYSSVLILNGLSRRDPTAISSLESMK
jgi:O-antigen/teichoic acid export membrane protein